MRGSSYIRDLFSFDINLDVRSEFKIFQVHDFLVTAGFSEQSIPHTLETWNDIISPSLTPKWIGLSVLAWGSNHAKLGLIGVLLTVTGGMTPKRSQPSTTSRGSHKASSCLHTIHLAMRWKISRKRLCVWMTHSVAAAEGCAHAHGSDGAWELRTRVARSRANSGRALEAAWLARGSGWNRWSGGSRLKREAKRETAACFGLALEPLDSRGGVDSEGMIMPSVFVKCA
ncbi:hypothetical protein CC80DRAFT_499056 [Byssothecium circinans]|uniref:Uncharacterized protein n=1 Tax=Byssothecium circinans TaxID=147558 RepID=A0A6A5UD90_9PLEO|nr:hypothetical protein CC80DRAFT_499056 [Byssothecium circinans]